MQWLGAGERAVAGAAQAVTANATGASLTDTVTTLLFFAAVAALSAITLGVCVICSGCLSRSSAIADASFTC